MSHIIIRELIEKLPNDLKKSKESAKNALDKILEHYSAIESQTSSSKMKTYIGFYTFTRCAVAYQNNKENFQLYIKCLKIFVPGLCGTDYFKLVPYILSFIANAIKNKENNEIICSFLFIYFKQRFFGSKEEYTILEQIESILQYYFRIVNGESELKFCFDTLNDLYYAIRKFYPNNLINISLKFLNDSRNIKMMCNNLNLSRKFFSSLFSQLEICRFPMKNLDSIYENITTMMITFVKMDKLTGEEMAKSFLHSILANKIIDQNKFYVYSLLVYYMLLKKPPVFIGTMRKFDKLLDKNAFNEFWYCNALIIFPQFFDQIYTNLEISKSEEWLELTLQITIKLTDKLKNCPNLSKNKLCQQCCPEEEILHAIFLLYFLSLDVAKKKITPTIQPLIHAIISNLNYYQSENLRCAHLKRCFKSILICSYNILISTLNITDLTTDLFEQFMRLLIANSSHNLKNLQLLKVYEKFYAVKKTDLPKLLEIRASLVGNIFQGDDVESLKYLDAYVFDFIKTGIEINSITNVVKTKLFNISDVIKKSQKIPNSLKPNDSINYGILLQKQLEISILYDLLPADDTEQLILIVLEITEDSLLLKTLQVVSSCVKKISSREIFLKIEKITAQIENNMKSNFTKDAVINLRNRIFLSVSYMFQAVQKFAEMKANSKANKLLEEKLCDIDFKDLDKLKLMVEVNAIKLAEKSLENFEIFVQKYLEISNCKELDTEINWDLFFDDFTMLARQLELRSYNELALKIWKLIYEMANSKKSIFTQIRAMSYFCKNHQLLQDLNSEMSLKENLSNLSSDILEKFTQLDSLSSRKQNYVLILLLYMAKYYAEAEKNISIYFYLKEMVFSKINTIDSRKNCFELVRGIFFACEFEIALKYGIRLKEYNLLNLLHNILEEICHIKYITSEDSINIAQFLFDFFQYITYHLISTSEVQYIMPKIYILFNFAFENGLPFRLIEITVLWALLNLHSDKPLLCETKLVIINRILGKEFYSNVELAGINAKNTIKEIVPTPNNLIDYIAFSAIEETRRQTPNRLSPKNFKMSAASTKLNVTKYLIEHTTSCQCYQCKYNIKFLYFLIGCVHVRMMYQYRSAETNKNELFYRKAINCFENVKYSMGIYRTNYILMLFHYVDVLQDMNCFQKGIEICDFILKSIPKEYYCNGGFYWKAIEKKIACKHQISMIQEESSKNLLLVNLTPHENLINCDQSSLFDTITKVNIENTEEKFSLLFEEIFITDKNNKIKENINERVTVNRGDYENVTTKLTTQQKDLEKGLIISSTPLMKNYNLPEAENNFVGSKDKKIFKQPLRLNNKLPSPVLNNCFPQEECREIEGLDKFENSSKVSSKYVKQNAKPEKSEKENEKNEKTLANGKQLKCSNLRKLDRKIENHVKEDGRSGLSEEKCVMRVTRSRKKLT